MGTSLRILLNYPMLSSTASCHYVYW